MHPDIASSHPCICQEEIKQDLDAHYIGSCDVLWHPLALGQRVGYSSTYCFGLAWQGR
jgi:hypothetical protein